MMIFGFIIGAGAGFGVTYMSGVQDKMVIAGAMAGLGIVLAVVSFLIYRAGIFVLGFGIGITLSIYLVHPTSSFSFFLCILIGVGLGVLAMRYAKGVIIVGTSIPVSYTHLEKAPLPKDVIALGVNGIRKIWHDKKMRGRGVTEDRAKTLVEAAHNSVGLDGGIGTKSELYMLLRFPARFIFTENRRQVPSGHLLI